MSVAKRNLWDLTFGQPWIDPAELAAAVESQVEQQDLDFRTRLLVRDSLEALTSYWGRDRVEEWMRRSRSRDGLAKIKESDLGPAGFHTLYRRLMDAVKPETIEAFFRELGSRLPNRTRITVGGSISLMLTGSLHRGTDDVDVVNEVPIEIRSQHELLDRLAQRHGLRITHFQSHFLPGGWEKRVRFFGGFGQLDVDLIDPYDIVVGKLFSNREKDLDDLRVLAGQLEKARIEQRLRESAASLRADENLSQNAARNWYIVYGETIPP